MQKLAEICIRRPVFATMLILALVVVGSAAYFRLGVDRFPSVDLPSVSVRTTLGSAGSLEVTSVFPPGSEMRTSSAGLLPGRTISGDDGCCGGVAPSRRWTG